MVTGREVERCMTRKDFTDPDGIFCNLNDGIEVIEFNLQPRLFSDPGKEIRFFQGAVDSLEDAAGIIEVQGVTGISTDEARRFLMTVQRVSEQLRRSESDGKIDESTKIDLRNLVRSAQPLSDRVFTLRAESIANCLSGSGV